MSIRRASERGHFDFGWLKTFHTFSFGDYYEPRFMGFRDLRVINDDTVAPGEGFPTHPHRDMEILTYILAGQLEHKDSMGNGAVLKTGTMQYMSAGTGVRHSEFNPSDEEAVHLLQIWVIPDEKDLKPNYDQRDFSIADHKNSLFLLASKSGREGSIKVHQDLSLYASLYDANQRLEYRTKAGRGFWLQLIEGRIKIGAEEIGPGDAYYSEDAGDFTFEMKERSHFLFFDLP